MMWVRMRSRRRRTCEVKDHTSSKRSLEVVGRPYCRLAIARSWNAQGIVFCASVLAYVCFPIGGRPKTMVRICQMPQVDWQSSETRQLRPLLKSFSGQINILSSILSDFCRGRFAAAKGAGHGYPNLGEHRVRRLRENREPIESINATGTYRALAGVKAGTFRKCSIGA
jgi:hypothetical protein